MSLRRDTANTLFRLLADEPVSELALEAASHWFESLETPLDRRSFMAYARVLQRPLPADSPLAGLAQDWRAAWLTGGFNEDNARRFLQDYITHLDPNLLFRAPITTGYARWDRARLSRGFAYGSQSEQAWSLLYCNHGGARLRAGGRDLTLDCGRVLLVEPGALYSLQPLDGHPTWGYFWCVFHPDSRWRNWLHWPQFAHRIGALRLAPPEGDRLATVFGELESCLHGDTNLSAELSHNLLEQLILRCRASLGTHTLPGRDARIQRAREFIQAHFAEDFSLEDVAAAASLSASRLSGLFRDQCGLSVLGYRDELRMSQAAQLLRDSGLGVAEIGARVGYADPAYFSRTFSRHVGVSPRSYQKSG